MLMGGRDADAAVAMPMGGRDADAAVAMLMGGPRTAELSGT